MLAPILLAITAGTAVAPLQTRIFAWTNANVAALPTTSGELNAFTLAAGDEVVRAKIFITGQGAGPTTLTVSAGRAGAAYIDYVVASTAKAAAGTVYGDAGAEIGTGLASGATDTPSWSGTTTVKLQFVSSGGNLSTVTGSAGYLELTVQTHPAAFASDNLQLTAPSPFGFYRRGADITVAGTNRSGSTCTIEASIAGGAFATIQANVANGASFSGTLSAPAACTNEVPVLVRCSTNTLAAVAVQRVSVGVVFAVVGQSGGSGFADNNQTYTGVWRGGLATNCGELGGLTDPWDRTCSGDDAVNRDTAGVTGAKGSWIPIAASELANTTNCPVLAVAGGTLGGTLIAHWLPQADHLNRSTGYGAANYRWQQAGGVDVVVADHGQADALSQRSQVAYNADIDTLANAIFSDRAAKLVYIVPHNSTGITDSDEAKINAAILEACSDNANVPVCVDLTDQTSDDFYHLTINSKILIAGQRIAAGMKNALSL